MNNTFMPGFNASQHSSNPLALFREQAQELSEEEIGQMIGDIPFSHKDVRIAFQAGQRYKILAYELLRRLKK
jgi:hypothetical protein